MDSQLPSLASALEHEFRQRAERANWTIAASERGARTGVVEQLLDALPPDGGATDGPPKAALPDFKRALDFSPVALRVLICGLDDVDVDASYRAALWWTGLVRSELPPARRTDLHLFLIAPRGSGSDALWDGRRSRYEADERFCRKFVWLPSGDPRDIEVASFVDRTFLAKPWEGTAAEPRILDPLEQLIQEFDSSKYISREEAQLWIQRLAKLDTEGLPQMAEDLVAIIGGRR